MADMRVVCTPEQLDRIGAFRYQVYIVEQGKSAAHADHAAQRLIEPADRAATSVIFYLERDDRLIATLRVELLSEEGDADGPACAVFDAIPASQTLRFTRLMVARDARGSNAVAQLMFHGFALALLKNCSVGLLTCKSDLVSMFETCGCMQYADAFVHAESGLQVPMAILGEADHLRQRAAPLASWLARHRPESVHTTHFMQRVAAWRATSTGAANTRTAGRLVAGDTERIDAVFA